MLSFFRNLKFRMYMLKRLGAYARFSKAGLSGDEALRKIDEIYPTTEQYREWEKAERLKKEKGMR